MKMVDKTSKLDKFVTNMSGSGGGGGSAGGGGGGGVGSGFGSGGLANLNSGTTNQGGTAAGGITGSSAVQHHHHHHSQNGKPVPMKLFAAWEVDRTPPNCIPRLCSLTITRLSILTPLPGDMTSLSLAVKMQSSKRTLRSHEIPITSSGLLQQPINSGTNNAFGFNMLMQQQQQQQQQQHQQQQGNSPVTGSGLSLSGGQMNSPAVSVGGSAGGLCNNMLGSSNLGTSGNMGNIGIGTTAGGLQGSVGVGGVGVGCGMTGNAPLSETELDLHFSLQYPHFIKRDGNRLVILLQRRKKYKSRTILGYKTLAEGIIRMDAVLQKSMDMTVELTASGKNGRPGTTVACLRAERVSSIPVDHDNKNNNSVMLADRVAEYSDEDEEGEFSSGEFNDEANDLGIPGYDPKRDYAPAKHDMRKYRKLQRSEVEDVALGTHPVDSDSEFEMKDKSSSRAKISRTISLQQRNFKQKIVALLKRFKASEELEGEVNRGTAALRGERDLDALFQELESLSCCEGDDSGPDMDSLSIGSTPKPSLRPFFTNSRIMLHDNGAGSDRAPDYRNDSSGNEANAANTDGQNSDPQNSPPRGGEDYITQLQRQQHQQQQQQQQQQMTPVNSSYAITTQATAAAHPPTNEKRSRLFRTSSNTPGSKQKKQTLSLSAEPRSVLETCLSPTNVEPRKLLLDQLSKVFASEDTGCIPDVVTIISPPEALGGNTLITKLTNLFANSFKPAFVPQNTAEVKAVLQALMGKIQKYCNSNAKPPTTVKILLIGGDWLQGAALRHYVELMGVRPPDWLNHLRFYIVPIGSNSSTMARHLSNIDQSYGAMFGTDNWTQLCERAAATAVAMSAVTTINPTTLSSTLGDSISMNKSDVVELVNRIQRYMHVAGPCTQIPIAEAMVNYKDEDSCQIFVPFVSDVRIGYLEGPQVSLDLEESAALLAAQHANSASSAAIPIGNSSSSTQLCASNPGGNNSGGLSNSPPQSAGRLSPPLQTPPSSATSQRERIGGELYGTPSGNFGGGSQTSNVGSAESVELQVDYWPLIRPGDHALKEKGISKSGDQGKNSIKSTFRNLQVWRLPQNAQLGEISHGLTVSFATKEKKQKQIMRLGKKKEKDRDLEKEQCVEGVSRLICSPKQSHPVPLRVYIDGTEWTGVKFFQLSSQWQTHVKNFPIALIGCTPMSCSELS